METFGNHPQGEDATAKEIPSQLAKLNKALAELSQNIDVLTNQLVPVIRTDIVMKDRDEPERRHLVPLADNIRDCIDKIEAINGQVDFILRGLQL